MGVFYTKPSTDSTPYKRKKWNGHNIDKCTICNKTIQLNFIYGRLRKCVSMWVVMCVPCSTHYGIGIAFDKGYVYRVREDGCYYKD